MNTFNIGERASLSLNGTLVSCRIINRYSKTQCYLIEIIDAVDIASAVELQSMSILKVKPDLLKKVTNETE